MNEYIKFIQTLKEKGVISNKVYKKALKKHKEVKQ